ncbi:MAG: helix-turn-helix domain-containing protein [Bacteroidota bacterium]
MNASLVMWLGLAQGLIVGAVAWTKHTLPTRLLACILFILCLSTFDTLLLLLVDTRDFTAINWLWYGYLPFDQIMILGPLAYFYVQSLFTKDFRLNRHHKRHFWPAILDSLDFVVSKVILLIQLLWGLEEGQLMAWDARLAWYEGHMILLQFLSVVYYLYRSWQFVHQAKLGADGNTLRWSRVVLGGMTTVVILWFPYLLLFLSPLQNELLATVFFFPIYYPIVAYIYLLTIYLMSGSFSFRPNPYSPQELQTNASRLDSLMETEKLYTQPNLKVSDLSQRSGIPTKLISYLLNHHYQKGFNAYVNEYRIREAKRQLEEGILDTLSLEGLGYEVGFASRSTFYRAFKEITGQHPTGYVGKSY